MPLCCPTSVHMRALLGALSCRVKCSRLDESKIQAGQHCWVEGHAVACTAANLAEQCERHCDGQGVVTFKILHESVGQQSERPEAALQARHRTDLP